jgi:hypothetical protein
MARISERALMLRITYNRPQYLADFGVRAG